MRTLAEERAATVRLCAGGRAGARDSAIRYQVYKASGAVRAHTSPVSACPALPVQVEDARGQRRWGSDDDGGRRWVVEEPGQGYNLKQGRTTRVRVQQHGATSSGRHG